MSEHPLVSAIAIVNEVTHPYVNLLIRSFQKQTYPYKELILVNNTQTQFAASKLEIEATPNVILYDTPAYVSAGMARNYGISIASGRIIAQFDADTYHFPDRLQFQVAALAKSECHISFLSKILTYSLVSGRVSLHTNNRGVILNSMVCIRPQNIDYPNTIKHEEFGILEKLSAAQYKTIVLQQEHLACKLWLTTENPCLKPWGTQYQEYAQAIDTLVQDYQASRLELESVGSVSDS
jgi:glycosyltransferase involved in cell wall biosynthesis